MVLIVILQSITKSSAVCYLQLCQCTLLYSHISYKKLVCLAKEEDRRKSMNNDNTYSVFWLLAPTVFLGSEPNFVIIPVPLPMEGHTVLRGEDNSKYSTQSSLLQVILQHFILVYY